MTRPLAVTGRILVVGDDAGSGSGLIALLRGEGHVVDVEADGFAAPGRLAELGPDLVLLDLEAAGGGGRALLGRMHASDPEIAVVAMTAVGAGVAALHAGARQYVTKPVDPAEVSLVVRRELEQRRLRAEAGQLRARLAERYRFENLIGSSAPMQAVWKTVAQVANARASVLLTGEPGTGKELIAAAIHEKSPRARGPFVRLHCGALSGPALERELFGHERGAFPGATTRNDGQLARAGGGTLFLGEIGAAPPSLQARLVRLLDEQRFERAGGSAPVEADVRLIAATSRDLGRSDGEAPDGQPGAGQLRADLLQRLSAIHIELPALRDRPSDVPSLATHFLRLSSIEAGKTVSGFTNEALQRLCGYAWPGNVRELEDVIRQAVALAPGPQITGAELPPHLRAARAGAAIQIPGSTLDAIERYAITQTLEATGGSTGRAAEILGISIRKVQYKLQEYQDDAAAAPPARTAGAKRN